MGAMLAQLTPAQLHAAQLAEYTQSPCGLNALRPPMKRKALHDRGHGLGTASDRNCKVLQKLLLHA